MAKKKREIFDKREQERRARDEAFQEGTAEAGRAAKAARSKSRKQAIAIGLSEARKKGQESTAQKSFKPPSCGSAEITCHAGIPPPAESGAL